VDDHTVPRNANVGGNGTSVVLLMVRDAYANYVVQTTLDVLPDTEGRKLLLEELGAHVEELVSWCLPGWQAPFLRFPCLQI
jgi:hypothetical protein